jgi:ABC-2 type transport system permease protein
MGARRTRVVAQVVGALAGALLFIISQAGTLMSDAGERAPSALARIMAAAQLLGSESWLLLPARASLGDPGALALLASLGLGAAGLTIGITHRFFIQGVQQAAGSAKPATPTGPVQFHFGRSLAIVVLIKEWRLIWRDPQLLSQVLLQLLYLLPLCLVLFRQDSAQLPALAGGLTMLCGSLSASLAWIILLAEDAPDLLYSSPAAVSTLRRAKVMAAVLPAFALLALPLAWLSVRAPLAGAVTALTASGAVLCAALINLWTGRPAPRTAFKSRGRRGVLPRILELINLVAWGSLALLLPRALGAARIGTLLGTGVAASMIFACGTLALAWLLRYRTVPTREN